MQPPPHPLHCERIGRSELTHSPLDVRYTRFINIDFIQDIVTALRELIGQDNSPLSVPTQLQCAITALQMLQQNSLMYNALNIDLKVPSSLHPAQCVP
jgi:hypothetical protein